MARSSSSSATGSFAVRLDAPPPPSMTTTTTTPLHITTATFPRGTVGTHYRFTLQALGGVPPFYWDVADLPPGLSVTNRGVVVGTPTQGGEFKGWVQVTDSVFDGDEREFDIVIEGKAPPSTTTTGTTAPPLAITTTSLPNGSVGVPYLFTLHAKGGVPPYDWGVATKNLPPGLSLTAEGVVTGTPAVAGDFTLSIEVTDTSDDIDVSQLDVVIGEEPTPTTATTTATTTTTTIPPTTTPTTAPVQVTNVSVSLSVTSSEGSSPTSLSDSYTATATTTCTFSNGTSGSCDLPDGSIAWEIVGGDDGGNFMYPSTSLTGCTSPVGAATATSICNVTWNTYGDQWLSATYDSSPSDQLQGQIVVPYTLPLQIKAPVDIGAGYVYDGYGNTGPQGLDDCTMAAAADWIETTFGYAPPSQDIVSDYWDAEDDFSGGADLGLSPDQLFNYWQTNGIDGTTLTAVNPVSVADVESELSQNYVLLASANLPSGYPLGDGQGGGHAWIVVGYSGYGPMIVSWGQEVQVSWSNFDNWTTGVWALGVSQS